MEDYGSDFESDDSGGISEGNHQPSPNGEKSDEYHSESGEEDYSDDSEKHRYR